MTAEIHILDVDTLLDIPAERILNKAISADLKTCIVLGYDPEDLLYVASTTSNKAEILYLLEQAKMFILNL